MKTLDQNLKAAAIIMIAALLLGHTCRSTAVADESAAALQILRTKCGSCHNVKNPKAGLNLTSLAGVFVGGESAWQLIKTQPIHCYGKWSIAKPCHRKILRN